MDDAAPTGPGAPADLTELMSAFRAGQEGALDGFASVVAFAGAIADEIGILLGPEDRERYRRASSMDPAVYEGYLRGMHLLNQSTPEAFTRALHYFHEAVDANPADPLAYTGLAFAYITLAHGPAPPPDALHLARAAAERAVRLDPDLPEAWAALADIRTYLLWDWRPGTGSIDAAAQDSSSIASLLTLKPLGQFRRH